MGGGGEGVDNGVSEASERLWEPTCAVQIDIAVTRVVKVGCAVEGVDNRCPCKHFSNPIVDLLII